MGVHWRQLAALFILLVVLGTISILVYHGYTLNAAIGGVGAAGAVAAGIVGQVLGPNQHAEDDPRRRQTKEEAKPVEVLPGEQSATPPPEPRTPGSTGSDDS